MNESLHTKYRPQTWADVLGQGAAVSVMQKILEKRQGQTFLLTGSSGIGKTTLARIAASVAGCKRPLEIDAATFTGVDEMRAVQEPLQYKAFSGDARAVIIDECHMLSKSAWNSLLKGSEEPSESVYWFFCTTDPTRVPKTIKTRCIAIPLQPVDDAILAKLSDKVCKLERIKLPLGVHDLLIHTAEGSPRQLLVNLALCRHVANKKEAIEALRTAVETDAIIELCRYLANGSKGGWVKAMNIINRVTEEPEGVRIVVVNYLAKALAESKTDREAVHFLSIMEQFSSPYNSAEKKAPLLLSIGRTLYNGSGEEE